MYILIHVHTYTCTYIYIHTHTHTCTCIQPTMPLSSLHPSLHTGLELWLSISGDIETHRFHNENLGTITSCNSHKMLML